MKYFPNRSLNQEIRVIISGCRALIDDYQFLSLKIIN